MADPLLRTLALLRLVPRHPRSTTAAQLREALAGRGFDIHERSVQRDLLRLSELLPLTCDESRPRRWSWPRDAESFDIPAMDPSTALAWELLDRHVAPLLPPLLRARFRPLAARATETLRSAGDSSYARWRDRVVVVQRGQPLLAPKVPEAVFDAVQTALFEGRVLEGTYRARSHPGEAAASRRLHPLGLVLREQLTYLVAVESIDAPIKQFALHRFAEVRLTDEPAQRPPRFQLRRWIDEQRGMDLPTGEIARVVLEVDAMTARHLEESALSRDQRVQWLGAEHARVEATLPITEQLLWWLLGHGRRVRVIAPASLRRRWLDAAGGAADGAQPTRKRKARRPPSDRNP